MRSGTVAVDEHRAGHARSWPAGLRVLEHQFQVFRRFWRGALWSYLLNPVLYLAAIGLGLGGLVDRHAGHVGGVTYLAFVTPGLMAASAMQAAAGESLWPVMAGTKWIRTYHAMVATPVAPRDVYAGVVAWVGVRVAMGATSFLGVAALLGGVQSAWSIAAVPATVLTALAFAAPLTAFTATQETDFRFPSIMRLGVVPLFLFSGTFFPVRQLPGWAQPVSWFSPLWHGVELCRGATAGSLGAGSAVVHVAVLIACVRAGWWWGGRTFTRKLTP